MVFVYVGLAHAVPHTNTKFQPLLLPTQADMSYTNTHKHRTSYYKSTLTFMGPAKRWKCLSAARQKREIVAILHHKNNWASEASPTLNIYMCVCRGPKSVGGIMWPKRAHAQSQYWAVKSDQ